MPLRRDALALAFAFAFAGAALLALGLVASPASPREDEWSVFGGAHVDDNWADVFRAPGGLEWRDTAMAGVA